MRKNFLTTVMGLLIAVSSFAYSGGNGSEMFPYLISSKADMQELAKNVSGGQKYAGIYFKLTRDLTGAEDTITSPIANFSGNFNGNGHEIALKIGYSSTIAGLFGTINGATIKNLGVSGSVISDPISDNSIYVGGICGFAINSEISNCYNTGNISSSSRYGRNAYSGGICGYMSNATVTIIENCYNTGVVSASTASSTSAGAYSGGICGGATSSTDHVIKSCYNIGNISAKYASSIKTTTYSGGICGYNASIQNCFVGNCQLNNTEDAVRSRIGRVGGSTSYGTYTNNYVYGMLILNGNAIASSDGNSKDGKDCITENLQDQAWLTTNLSWDFENNWIMPEEGGFPVLRSEGTSQPPLPATVTVTTGSNDNELGTTLGDGTYDRNASVILYAIPAANNVFTTWSDENTDNPRTLTATSDTTLTANFAACDNSALLEQIETLKADTVQLNTQITDLQDKLDECNILSGNEELRSASAISVYPNPTTGIVYLNAVSRIKVYDQQGTLLQEKTGDNVNLSSYASGIYLLQVDNEWVKVIKI